MRNTHLRCAFALLLAFATQYVVNNAQCPPGYRYFGTEKCFMVLSGYETYLVAKRRCADEANGGHLPVIVDEQDDQAVQSMWHQNSASGFPWIGLYCTDGNSCEWENDIEPYAYNSFQNGKPILTIGNCVAYGSPRKADDLSRYWVSSSCDDTKVVICETEPIKQCTSPYVLRNGKCMFLPDAKRNYWGAISVCDEFNGTLLSIHSVEENDQVLEWVRNKRHALEFAAADVFLGATYRTLFQDDDNQLSYRQFVWMDGSDFDQFNNFRHPFPNRRYGNCLKMVVDDDSVRYTGTINSNNVAERAGAWQNVACNAFLNFICVPKDWKNLARQDSESGQCPTKNFFSDEGTIASPAYPSYYGERLDCIYHINVPSNRFVGVWFDDFQLGENDFLALYDGEATVEPMKILTNDYATTSHGQEMEFNTTDANLLRLHFHTETIGSTTIFPDGDNNLTVTSKNETVEDVVINGLPRGWRLRYAASGERASSYTNVRRPALVVDDVCPRKRRFYPADVINHPTIESAGFSNGLHYANLVNCTYVIFAQNASDDDEGVSSAARVQLEFRAFHTERHHDFLQIYDGEFIDDAKLLTSMDGDDDALQHRVVITNGSAMTLRFITDSRVTNRGFSATYSFVVNATDN